MRTNGFEVEHFAEAELDGDLDLGSFEIGRRDVAGGYGGGVVGDGAEPGDGLGGRLDAAEERRDEDAVDREAQVVGPEAPAGAERAAEASLEERRVPRPSGAGEPERLEVVEPVAVPHHDDVLGSRFRGVQ